jgi:hypothetical protein
MADELHDIIDDSDVEAAFDGYRADPGGEVRVDAAAIAGAGRRRVRRHRIAVGVGGVAVIVAGIATVPNLGGGSHPDRSSQVAAGELPSTGRDAGALFGEAWGKREGGVKSGGGGEELGRKLAASLTGDQPKYLDAGWQPSPEGGGKSAEWALLTWVKGSQAAEGLLVASDNPVYVAVFPPVYQSCGATDEDGGRTCAVRKVDGEGWLKVVRGASGKAAELKISLQRMDGNHTGRMYGLSLSGGAVTKAGLADGRTALGTLPADEKAISDALLALP